MNKLLFYSLLLFLIDTWERFTTPKFLNSPPVQRWKPIEDGIDEDRYCAILKARREAKKGSNPLTTHLKNN